VWLVQSYRKTANKVWGGSNPRKSRDLRGLTSTNQVTPESGSPDTYTYDSNGNPSTGSGRRLTCRIENGIAYTHTYNAETCTEPVEVTVPPALPNARAEVVPARL